MAKTFGVWGIDIGQCALKALRLEIIDGQPTATAFDYIEHPKILSQPDADPDALTREALEKFLSRNPLGKDQVAIGVPGQSGLARFVKLPPVEEKKVLDIVKFEAKQQIPFPLEEVVWDYQKLSDNQEVIGGFAMETEIGLFAMKRDIINRFLGHYAGVKAEVHTVQMAPLALANYATYELLKKRGSASVEEPVGELPPGKKKKCAVLLDIGTDGSNLIITDGSKVIWQRPVPLGGNNFTRVLTKEMKLTFAKAEHLKRNAAKSPELAQILKALRPVLTDFVGEVQRSLGYFTNTHRDAHVAYLVGLGSAFKLPGLQKYLAEKLSLDVRKPNKIDGISGEAVLNDPIFQENVLTFPVAYGLALQGLALMQTDPAEQKRYALLRTNLLPQEIRVDRMIRAKKPWAAAAAATLLFGTACLALGFGCQYRTATDADLQKSMANAKGVVDGASKQNGEFKTQEGEISKKIGQVKAIIAGNDERLNWVRINQVVSTALPRPPLVDEKFNYILGPDGKTPLDEGNMIWPARDVGLELKEPWIAQYDYVRSGAEAIAKYSARVRAGVPADKLYENTMIEKLPLVNIEAIDCRFTDNLQGFLDAANTAAARDSGLYIVADLMDKRVLKDPIDGTPIKIKTKDPKTGEIKEDELSIPDERDPSDAPNVKGTQPWHKFNPKAPTGSGWVVEIRGYTYHTESYQFVRHSLVRNLQEFGYYAAKTDPDKVGKLLAGITDPAMGKVSHAFLQAKMIEKAAELKKDQIPALKLVTKSQLDTLVPAVGSAETTASAPPSGDSNTSSLNGPPGGIPGGPPGGNPYTASGAGGGGWPGLLKSGGAVGASLGGPGGYGGLGEGGVGFGGGGAATNTKNTKQLTEFIVYFIWQEPGTSDSATPSTPK